MTFKQAKYRDIKYRPRTNEAKNYDTHLDEFNKEIY